MTINFKPWTVIKPIIIIAICLVIASISGQLIRYITGHRSLLGLIDLFYIDIESNIPTFFISVLLLIIFLLLSLIFILKRREADSMIHSWALLAIGFLYISLDENIGLHEKLILPMRNLLANRDLGMFYYAWVIPGIIIVVLLGIFFLKFLRNLPRLVRKRFVIAASIYLGGAIGFELIGGYYVDHNTWDNFFYSMLATTEECLEMTGIITFIWALLKYISDNWGDVHFNFTGAAK